MQLSALTISLIAATLINGLLVYFTWRQRPANASTELFILLIAITQWSFFAIFESIATTVFYKVLFSIITYAGITAVPVLFLIFACRYVHLDKWLTKKNVSLLLIIPAVTLIIACTNHLHGLLWQEVTLGQNPLAGVFGIYSHGIWFWMHAVYSYILILIAIIILLVNMLRPRYFYLLQSRILILSSAIPFIANLAYTLLPKTIIGVDMTPVFFTFSGILLFFAIYYYKLFDLSPIAWETIIENLDDGVILFNSQNQVVDVNKSFKRILGIKKVTIGAGKDVLLERYREINLFCDSNTGGGKKEISINKENKKIFLELSCSNLYDKKNKNVIGWMLMVRDITEKKLAEEKLIVARKAAESANIAKSQFCANMSHEIRTPMNAISGFLQLLDKTRLNKEQKEFVNNINSSTESLLNIVNDILDISRIESGKLQLEKIAFDIRQAIEKAVIPFSVKAKEKSLELNLLVSTDIPQMVVGDPIRLRQVISNLISNAIKFTEKGNIFLEASLKRENKSELEILFKIKDTGIGIQAGLINKLFKPFTQADLSSTRKYGGTGLGLSICKNIVQMMGGDISVYSKPGKGATFIFSVILKKPKDEKKSAVPDYSILKGKKILIVDDSAMNRKIAKIYLQETECVVDEAETGYKALDKIIRVDGRSLFDVVVLDYQMPGTSGSGLLTALKAITFTKNIPLILVTSVASNSTPDKKNSNVFSGYLTKPYRRNELLDCVVMAVQGRKYKKAARDIIATEQKDQKQEVYAGKKIRILLVEDNEVNRLFFIKLLQLKKLNCDVAINGKEAVEACKNKDYDIIFMDCQMPVMDGFDATRNIRKAESENKHTIIIAMTAYATKEDEQKCLDTGMDGYISKPVNLDRVMKIIRSNMLAIKKKHIKNTKDNPFKEKVIRKARIINSKKTDSIKLSSQEVVDEKEMVKLKSDEAGSVDIEMVFEKINRDLVFLKNMVRKFKLNSAKLLSEINSAIELKDSDTLRMAAHSLKGILSVFYAEKGMAVAKRLENIGKSGNFVNSYNVVKKLEKELKSVIKNFEYFIKKKKNDTLTE